MQPRPSATFVKAEPELHKIPKNLQNPPPKKKHQPTGTHNGAVIEILFRCVVCTDQRLLSSLGTFFFIITIIFMCQPSEEDKGFACSETNQQIWNLTWGSLDKMIFSWYRFQIYGPACGDVGWAHNLLWTNVFCATKCKWERWDLGLIICTLIVSHQRAVDLIDKDIQISPCISNHGHWGALDHLSSSEVGVRGSPSRDFNLHSNTHAHTHVTLFTPGATELPINQHLLYLLWFFLLFAFFFGRIGGNRDLKA